MSAPPTDNRSLDGIFCLRRVGGHDPLQQRDGDAKTKDHEEAAGFHTPYLPNFGIPKEDISVMSIKGRPIDTEYGLASGPDEPEEVPHQSTKGADPMDSSHEQSR